MDSPAPLVLARGDVMVVATTQRQVLLGDVEDSEERRLTLVEETNKKMERLATQGINHKAQAGAVLCPQPAVQDGWWSIFVFFVLNSIFAVLCIILY